MDTSQFAGIKHDHFPLPLCDHVTNCRICGAPLAEFHIRYAKYCGQGDCPTSKGCCAEFQLAPRTWQDQAEKLVKAFGE